MSGDRFGPPVETPPRLYREPEPTTRSETQRDRDRILYSSAFLRLGHVTQVTAPEAGRVFHTRLTHTLKARRVAEAFVAYNGALFPALDPDAVEAAALAHDLGHPPFGHIIEHSRRAAIEGSDDRARFAAGRPSSLTTDACERAASTSLDCRRTRSRSRNLVAPAPRIAFAW